MRGVRHSFETPLSALPWLKSSSNVFCKIIKSNGSAEAKSTHSGRKEE